MTTAHFAFFTDSNTRVNDTLEAMGDALFARPGWHADAACRGAALNPDQPSFFPERGSNYEVSAAQAICAGCKVRLACLEYAMSGRMDMPGVWGGTTNNERRRLRRQRSRERRGLE